MAKTKLFKGDLRKVNPRTGKATPEYAAYDHMKQRCSNPNDAKYPLYGARGIKICARWLGPDGFDNFFKDMGRRPGRGYSLDRRDNDGDYTPENCRWTTATVQSRNQGLRKDNTSGYRGVSFSNEKQKWRATICIDRKCYFIGAYNTPEEAAEARKLVEDEFWKDGARMPTRYDMDMLLKSNAVGQFKKAA